MSSRYNYIPDIADSRFFMCSDKFPCYKYHSTRWSSLIIVHHNGWLHFL